MASRATGILVLVSMLVPAAESQSDSKPLSFASVSIRAVPVPSAQEFASGRINRCIPKFTADSGRLEIVCNGLGQLIVRAFGVGSGRIEGPDWSRSPMPPGTPRFDISATLPAGATDAQIPEMLQAFLKQRFGLEFHWETRDLPSLDLTVAEGGFHAKPAATAPPAPLSGPVSEINGVQVITNRLPTANGFGSLLLLSTPEMGTVRDENPLLNPAPSIPKGSVRRIDAPSITAKGMAELLMVSAGLQVTDKTGLSGRFEMHLEIATDEFVAFTRRTSSGYGAERPAIIRRALRDVLKPYGLELIPSTAPVDFFVIDRVEKPATE